MRQQDIIWGEGEWEEVFEEYRNSKHARRDFLIGLGITLAGWGLVFVCGVWL